MAEIRVEPKKSAPIWPWIIGIIILLGLIWLLVDAFERDDPEEQREEQLEEREDAVEDRAEGAVLLDGAAGQPLALTIYSTDNRVTA